MTPPLGPEDVRDVLDKAAAGPTTGDFDAIFARASRARRDFRSGAVTILVILVIVAIGVPVAIVHHNRRATSGPFGIPRLLGHRTHANPLRLFGTWTLAAAGEAPNTEISFGDQITINRLCGQLEGPWEADPEGIFAADIDGGSEPCLKSPQHFNAPWLTESAGFRVVGNSVHLVAADGQVTATLTDRRGDTQPGSSLTSRFRLSLRQPRPLPAGVTPATTAAIQGRWRAIGSFTGRPGYAEFKPTTWDGTNGCNGEGGRLEVGPGGDFMALAGGTSAVFCGVSPEPGWVDQARRAGIEHGDLVLYDVNGKLLGRLARQPVGTISGSFEQVGGPPLPGGGTRHQPLNGEVEVHLGGVHGQVVASVETDHHRFTVSVPPGRYVLTAVPPHWPNGGYGCRSYTNRTVSEGATVHLNVLCEVP